MHAFFRPSNNIKRKKDKNKKSCNYLFKAEVALESEKEVNTISIKRIKISYAILIVVFIFFKAFRIESQQHDDNYLEQIKNVPEPYQNIYHFLKLNLDDFEKFITKNWDASKHNIIFGASLLSANGNLGDILFYASDVNIVELDAFKALGVEGVTVSINYPLLSANYEYFQKYTNYYKKLATEIRKRDMKMVVEMNPVFSGTVFSTLKINFGTFEDYKNGLRSQTENVMKEIKPDILIVLQEPTTAYNNTKIKDFLDPKKVAEAVQFVIKGLDRKNILIGAGAGTWEDKEYFERFTEIDIDYLDIHVYPLSNGQKNYLSLACEYSDLARKKGEKYINQ